MEGQEKKEMLVMFLITLGGWVRLGADRLGKKERCPQSPLCMSRILSIIESSLSMRLWSVLKYPIKQILLRASEMGERVLTIKMSKTSALLFRQGWRKAAMRVFEAVGGGSDFHNVLWGRVGEGVILFLRDLGKYSLWLGGENTRFGVGGVRLNSKVQDELPDSCEH